MYGICRSEMIKMKRSSAYFITAAIPVTLIILAALLGMGGWFQYTAVNWWYTFMLPAILALICANSIQRDSRLNYYGILSLPVKKERIWLAKILVCALISLASTAVMIGGMIVGGLFLGNVLTVKSLLVTVAVIFVTFMWQIPVLLLISRKLPIYVAVIASMFLNLLGIGAFATESYWYLFPYSMPSRLMVPIAGMLPNGIIAIAGDPLLDSSVILPGIVMSMILFVVLSFITMKMFAKQEVSG